MHPDGMSNIVIFYFIAQIIERFLELLDWIISFFMPAQEGEKGTKRKSAKMIAMWFLAMIFALGFVYWLDLRLMERLRVVVSPDLDKLLSALVIGSGTKPIHDIISLVNKKK